MPSNWVAFEVVHHVPGRLRLRVPALKGRSPNGMVDSWQLAPGVTGIRANFTCASVVITYDPRVIRYEALLRSLASARRKHGQVSSAVQRFPTAPSDLGRKPKRAWLPLVASSFAFGLTALAGGLPGLLLRAAVTLASVPIYKRAVQSIKEERRLNVDVLDAAASVVMTARGNLVASGFMTWLISVGEYIRDLTARHSQRAAANLLGTVGHTAWVIRDGKKVQVRVEELAVKDIVLLYPGDLVPVDGRVVKGEALLDEKTLTGEPLPVTKSVGDAVSASTVLTEGSIYVQAERVGYETKAGQIINLIESAPVHDTRMENYAAKFADSLVLPSFMGAGATLAISRSAERTAAFLIVDFGTGIRVTAPTTVLATMAMAARNGILMKSGRSMEKLAAVDTVIFDKTGTLTRGQPEVVEVVSLSDHLEPEDILRLAATAELRLKHPAARAIIRHAEELGISVPEREMSRHFLGSGVRAVVAKHVVHVGNARLMDSAKVAVPPRAREAERFDGREESLVFVAVDGELVGVIAYTDPVRPESRPVVEALKGLGVRDILMVTGDHWHAASAVAKELGIVTCYAEVLPQQKAQIVKQLQAEGRLVAVVGDGVNDSAAFAYADVAIALSTGAAAAKQTADVVLMRDSIWELPLAVEAAKEAIATVQQNYRLTVIPNVAALALSVFGVLGPVGVTLVSNGSTIVAGLRSLQPLFRRNGKVHLLPGTSTPRGGVVHSSR